MLVSRPARIVLTCGIASLLAVSPAAFADSVWTGAVNTDWNNAGNWTAGVPTGTNARINTAVPNIATITANPTGTPVDVFIGNGSGTTGIVNQTAGTASTGNGNWLFIGTGGGGTGTFNLADTTTTGGALTGFGTGTGSYSAGNLYVGGGDFNGDGTGVFNMNTSGSVNANQIFVGSQSNASNGSLNLDLGAVSSNADLNVGQNGGTGNINVSGGTVTTNGWIFIGRGGGGNGTVTMSGGSISNPRHDGRVFVGDGNAVGKLVMSGGTFSNTTTTETATSYVVVGEGNLANAATSSISMTGGTLTTTTRLTIGGDENGAGKGSLTVSGSPATVHADGDIWVGDQAGSLGSLTLSAGKVETFSSLIVGNNGATGSVALSGGTLSVDGTVNIAAGNLAFTGGKITRSNAGNIAFNGNLTIGTHTGVPTIELDANKTFSVSGAFDITTGVAFNLTGDVIPAFDGFVQTGFIGLGTDGSIIGTFDPSTSSVLGLSNLPGATFISETNGKSSNFNPNTQSVYWIQQSAGAVSLQYSVAPSASAPEPGTFGLLTLGVFALAGRRRRK